MHIDSPGNLWDRYLFSHDFLYFISLLAELLRTFGIVLLVGGLMTCLSLAHILAGMPEWSLTSWTSNMPHVAAHCVYIMVRLLPVSESC